ncbi:MAG TPA: hypothetical protein VK540_26725 [Polyangiaceae bacterium]|nr:hypothetical protein [Polyangiaceae bacterium]
MKTTAQTDDRPNHDQTDDAADLRVRADEAINAWRTACAATADARERLGAGSAEAEGGRRVGSHLDCLTTANLLDLEVRALEAEDAASLAAAAAAAALHLAEVAERDELATACDPVRATPLLAELVDEEERLRNALVDASARAVTFIQTMRNASAKLSARRRADKLPPHVLPTPALGVVGVAGYATPRDWVEALASGEVASPARQTERIARLRNEEVELRAELELSRIADEERRAAEAFDAERRRKDEAERARKARAEHDKLLAKHESARDRATKLAEDHRARTAG